MFASCSVACKSPTVADRPLARTASTFKAGRAMRPNCRERQSCKHSHASTVHSFRLVLFGRPFLYTTTPHHPEGVVCTSCRLNSSTVAVSETASRRWWCIESLFPSMSIAEPMPLNDWRAECTETPSQATGSLYYCEYIILYYNILWYTIIHWYTTYIYIYIYIYMISTLD